MKPTSKLHGFNYDQQKININGPRPTPLMIRKPNSSHKQQRVPIIIYTQSPKIIHTKAQDFMALVQRLTGMSTTNQVLPRQQEVPESSLSDGSNNNSINFKQHEGDETTSTTSSVEKEGVNSNINYDEQSPNNMMKFAEMPLFTPTSCDFFSPNNSSRPVYKFSDSPYGILGSLISPSGLGFIQDLPEY
ncbi:VQ motif-containing protein 8, chloroplastic-like [Lathyrus oleraceus]|uniref:VQ motif-containing protein 8, chloroplastic-like n=1 Tax=Pisum sativum TaxID=3888 RepID=UPI0021CF7A76|nr:VQ motif-containing protein 8, chloroplastic-like [Pisum sativum]